MYPTTRTRADHREPAVDHVFRFAECCEYLVVIRDAERPITTGRRIVSAAEKLAKSIIANYNNQLGAALAVALLLSMPALGQNNQSVPRAALVMGTVTDVKGDAIPDATVVLKEVAKCSRPRPSVPLRSGD
jgi:hypothetical protein